MSSSLPPFKGKINNCEWELPHHLTFEVEHCFTRRADTPCARLWAQSLLHETRAEGLDWSLSQESCSGLTRIATGWGSKCSSAMCLLSEALGTCPLATFICLDDPNDSTTLPLLFFRLVSPSMKTQIIWLPFPLYLDFAEADTTRSLNQRSSESILPPSPPKCLSEAKVFGVLVLSFSVFLLCLSYWLGSVRANVAATMDKHAYSKRKGKKETVFTGCLAGLDGGGEGKESKYVRYCVHERETNGIGNSSILRRQGEARINIGIR